MSAPLSPEVARLLEGKTTVAARIRALAAAGYPRAEIARMLGKRYQHVRNVLEEPGKAKVESAPPEPAPPEPAPGGMAEGDAGTFVHDRPRTYRLEVRDGSVALPPEVLKALGAGPNGVIIADLGQDTLTLISTMKAVERIQERLRPYWTPGVSIVDEFIADRRREAEREDREADAYEAGLRHDD